MNKKIAVQLLPLVNEPFFQNLIDFYIEERKNEIRKSLEFEEKEVIVRWHQGKMQELDNLKTLKDKVQHYIQSQRD